jgi:hypothetical protein
MPAYFSAGHALIARNRPIRTSSTKVANPEAFASARKMRSPSVLGEEISLRGAGACCCSTSTTVLRSAPPAGERERRRHDRRLREIGFRT